MNVLLLTVLMTVPSSAPADLGESPSLKRATTVFAVAAAIDWASTLNFSRINRGLEQRGSRVRVYETNSMINWVDNQNKMVLLGAAIDVAAVYAWNKTVGQRYPRLARAGLYAASAFRFYLAYKNYRVCKPMMKCQL